jgi:hypothetical protein
MKYEVIRFWDDCEDQETLGFVSSTEEGYLLQDKDLEELNPFSREHVYYKMVSIKDS